AGSSATTAATAPASATASASESTSNTAAAPPGSTTQSSTPSAARKSRHPCSLIEQKLRTNQGGCPARDPSSSGHLGFATHGEGHLARRHHHRLHPSRVWAAAGVGPWHDFGSRSVGRGLAPVRSRLHRDRNGPARARRER